MSLLDAFADPEFRRKVGRGMLDAGNRGAVAGLLGAPVDLATAAINLPVMAGGYAGHRIGLLDADQMPQPITEPVGGSEWIGRKMQDAGMVSPDRNPLAEALAAVAVPGGAVRGARALPVVEADSVIGLLAHPAAGTRKAQAGVISPEGKKRLIEDLTAGQSSGRYVLGDVSDGQQKALERLYGRSSDGKNVHMGDRAHEHLMQGRIAQDGFTPEEVARFAQQALEPRAKAWVDPAKSFQNPSLLGQGQRDPLTGGRYDAQLPMRQEEGGYGLVTLIPKGLPARKSKTPKR